MTLEQGTRVRILAQGKFRGWDGIVQARKSGQGFWLFIPGHPWQAREPDLLWHFYDHEIAVSKEELGE